MALRPFDGYPFDPRVFDTGMLMDADTEDLRNIYGQGNKRRHKQTKR